MSRPSVRSALYAWLLLISVALAIYLDGAPALARAGLVILSVLFLGLLTLELVDASRAGQPPSSKASVSSSPEPHE